jgi:hypothetical protein
MEFAGVYWTADFSPPGFRIRSNGSPRRGILERTEV